MSPAVPHLGPEVEQWVRKHIAESGPIRFEPLRGATSSAVYAVTGAGVARWVLRLFTDHDWLGREADLADHETAALTHAERAGLPAPRFIAQATRAECGHPALLMTHLPGQVDLRPRRRRAWIQRLADTLARIHQTGTDSFGWWYTSWSPHGDVAMPAWFDDEALWLRVREVETVQPSLPSPTFLHRDYHPANVIWLDGAVSGVVDWVNACIGPAGVDVAHCRINLALMHGIEYADDFLGAYVVAVGGYEHDPHWDVDAAMSWGLSDPAYYPPWRDFGLRQISPGVLRDRMRTFLDHAVARS
jgi:aminoglycoside phosphotransferase (APT) family kinase protein